MGVDRVTLILAVALIIGASSQTVFEDVGACPFECCTYREWTTRAPTAVRCERQADSPVGFHLAKGDVVTGVTGVVVTRKPGKAVVIRAMTLECGDEEVAAKPGDVLELLRYAGEGTFKFRLRGKLCVDDLPWPKGREKAHGVLGTDGREVAQQIRTESLPDTVWWVQVRNRDGAVGWTSESDHFEHMDACE